MKNKLSGHFFVTEDLATYHEKNQAITKIFIRNFLLRSPYGSSANKSWAYQPEISDLYSGFLLWLIKNDTLNRFNSSRGSFYTYISRCLKNYLNMRVTNRSKLLNSTYRISERKDSFVYENEALKEVEAKKDIYAFYNFYANHLRQTATPRKQDRSQELKVLKLLILGLSPSEISSEIDIPKNTVYFYRKKYKAWYKSFIKNSKNF